MVPAHRVDEIAVGKLRGMNRLRNGMQTKSPLFSVASFGKCYG